MRFAAFADGGFGFGIGEVLDALLCAPVEFDPETFVLRVDEAVGMAAKSVHVAIAGRNAAVAHDDGDLMQCFGQQGPEIPVIGGTAADWCAGRVFTALLRSGNFSGSRKKNTGVLLPTRSQLPSSV